MSDRARNIVDLALARTTNSDPFHLTVVLEDGKEFYGAYYEHSDAALSLHCPYRGNGMAGEDVVLNIHHIQSITVKE